MTTDFLSQDIWPNLTKAVGSSKQRCAAAVAYLGAGASRLLPLPQGSRLVVDASERAVASGQTCPADLIALVKRGLTVFSFPNLHAKVFVVGRAAYIGSTNASNRSANHLVEAAIRTTEPDAVSAAREFVNAHCLHELTPQRLKQLAKLYRPPLIPGNNLAKKPPKGKSSKPLLPRLLLAQLVPADWPEEVKSIHDSGFAVAKQLRKHPRRFVLDSFQWDGKCPYLPGDVVIQISDEGKDSVLATPPGNVLYVRPGQVGTKLVSIVFLEHSNRRRRQVKTLARVLGCEQKRLRRNGLILNQSFAQTLLNTWAVTS